MLRLARRVLHRDALNGGSSMTLGSKGMKLSPDPLRRRMPWTAAKEYVPGVVLNAKEKMVLDGVQLVDVDNIDRASQIDPLEVLRATVATYEYNTSTGKNIFQLASQVEFNGRGQRFYRKEWQEGTYDKYITLSAIDFSRDGNKGIAYGYITFHGETTARPVQIDFADVPGWCMEFRKERAVSFSDIVPPPPSVGTEIPVDPRSYRLKAYPFYDAPNPPEFVERLLKDRGVLPDTPTEAAETIDDPAENDGSMHHTAMPKLRVTLCQMAVVKSKKANLSKAAEMVTAAARRGAGLVVLPECFNSPYGTKYFDEYSEEIRPGSLTYDAMSELAKENNVWLIAGSIPERSGGKLYNSSMIFDSTGNLQHVHRKVHLFRINTESVKMDEGEVLAAGNMALPVSMNDGVKFGVGICFDIRYPLFAWKYANEGSSFLVFPAAFNMVTGPLHWELLARARAADNQQYVLLCSPARDSNADYVAWGHSMVVDPMGKVIATTEEGEAYVDAELDFDLIESTRKHIPILSGVRHDIYSLLWK